MRIPRTYTGIAVAMRDPGGTLSEPIAIADADAGGVRHPALAIDPTGDALLAYNTATNEVHLNMRGAIAIAHRDSGGSFSEPKVVDRTPSLVAAAGEDGAATLAWISHHAVGKGRSARTRYDVRALVRTAGHSFAAARTVASSTDSCAPSRSRATRRRG
jgi:hypothetical protein